MGTRCGAARARRVVVGIAVSALALAGGRSAIPAGAAPATAPATVRATPATGLADLDGDGNPDAAIIDATLLH